MVYESIIFLDGDGYAEFEACLYPESTPEDLRRGMLMGWPNHKAAFEHLRQWDYGDPTEPYTGEGDPWGSDEKVIRFDNAGRLNNRVKRTGYVMAYHTGLSHASLYRIVERPADAWF